LDPTEGSEQAGSRPVIIVSRDAINDASRVVLAVPCTTYRVGRRIYPSQVLVYAPDGGLDVDSVALGEQVRALAKSRLLRQRGAVSPQTLRRIDRALAIALDLSLPGS
jgi:mRNA interferase MazF